MKLTLTYPRIPAKGSQVSERGKSPGPAGWLFLTLMILAGFSAEKAHAVLVTINGAAGSTCPTCVTNTGTYTGMYYSTSYPYTTGTTIYGKDELGKIGKITSYALNKTSGSATAVLDSVYIFMKEVSLTETKATTTISLAGYTEVFRGDFTNTATSGWMTVNLSTPFNYTGTGNLSVILVRRKGSAALVSQAYSHHYTWGSPYGCAYHYSTTATSWSSWLSPSSSSALYTYDYYRPNVQFNIDDFDACTGTPTAGTALASTTTACAGDTVNFSLGGSSMASGITYEWDTSATGTGGWALAGTTTATPGLWKFLPPEGRTLYYRCRLTCVAGGTTVTSTSVSVSAGNYPPLPYIEDFESATPGVNVPCAAVLPRWDPSTGTTGTSPAYWRLLNGAPSGTYGWGPRSGNQYLWTGLSVGSYNSAPIGYWFSPAFNLKTGSTYRFSYWYRTSNYVTTYGSSQGVNFGMYFSKSNTKSTGLTAIKPDLLTKSNSTYEENTGDFTVPANGAYYMAIKVDNVYYPYYGGGIIDDINLTQLPDCNTATTLGTGVKASVSPNVICAVPGTTKLSVTKTPAYSGLSFNWEIASATPTSFSSAGVSGMTTDYTITTGGIYYFRCKITCTATGIATYSDTVRVVTTPITPPYTEDFETGSPNVNMPCASFTGSFGDMYWQYWNVKAAPFGPTGPGVVNHTTGGSKYLLAGYGMGSYSSQPARYWFTPGLALTSGKAYNFSFWYSNNGYYPGSYATNKVSMGVRAGTAQTEAAMTIALGDDTTITPNASATATYDKFTRGFISPTTGTYYIGIRWDPKAYIYPGVAIDDIGLEQLPPCAAKPAAGMSYASPSMICATGTTTLSLKGVSLASDLSFQWYEANASGGLIAALPGATGLTYTTGTISTGPKYYRCVVTCGAIASPNTDTSVLVRVQVGPITPPYKEDFETAIAGVNQPCASFTNTWDAGSGTSYYNYWGIKDEPGVSTYSASIRNRTPGGKKYLSSGSFVGEYSLGTVTGNQQYWFSPPLQLAGGGMAYKCNYWYVTNSYSYSPGSAMTVGLYYGVSQSAADMMPMRPDILGETNTNYRNITGTLRPASAGVYYLGVKINHAYGYYGGAVDDIGVEQLAPCTAKPAAGNIYATPIRVCSSGTAVLRLSGTTDASMISFQWLESGSPSGPWMPVTGGSGATTDVYTTASLTAPKWYRCEVTCSAATAPNKDTTPVFKMNVGALEPPYVEDFESAIPGNNVVCASYSGTWATPASYNYWTIRGTPYVGSPLTLDNRTPGGKNFLHAGIYISSDEYWWSPGLNLKKDSTYQMSYWYNGSGYPTGGATTFGMYYGTAQTKAAMTAIAPDLTNVNVSVYKQFVGRFIAPASAVYYLGVKVRHTYSYSYYGVAVDDIGLEQLPACTGVPVAGAVSVKPAMLCATGSTAFLNMDLAGVSKVAGLSYRWEWSTTPTFATTATAAPQTNPAFTSPALVATTWFRCIVKCTNTGDSTISGVVKVDVGVITPPYIETFETGTPGTNMPCASYTGGWSSGYYWYLYGAPMGSGAPTADNHTPGGSKYLLAGYGLGTYSGLGDSYWFTPAIKFTGGKLYQFNFWYNGTGYSGGLSTIGAYYGTAQTAAAMTTAMSPDLVGVNTMLYKEYKARFTPATSGNYYIGIKINNSAVYNYPGISIDDIGLQEVPPCSAPVVAGTITADPAHVCASGGSTTLELLGSTLATGLTYQWLSATTAAGPYTSAGAGYPFATPALYGNTWFRAIITCTATGSTDTSAAFMVGVGGLSLPYVEDFESTPFGEKPICSDATDWGVGYGAIYGYVWGIMKSGLSPLTNHTPGGKTYLVGGYYLGYTAYAPYGYPTVTPNNFWFTPGLALNSRYKYSLSLWYQAAQANNRMGIFYGTAQSVTAMTNTLMPLTTISNTTYMEYDTVFAPATTGVYYLGLQKTTVSAGYAGNGIAFDDINLNYAPCDGMPYSGNIKSATASGTGLCKGTLVELVDTGASIAAVPGIRYQWQRKAFTGTPVNWTNIEGATDTILRSDTLIGYQYRLAVICSNTNDTALTGAYLLPQLPPHPAVTISPSSSPIMYCFGDTVHLNATHFAGAVYDWMLEGASVAGWKFSDMGATEPGTYVVKVTSALSPCPGYSAPVKLVANDPGYKVDITLPSDSILCAGSRVMLTAVASKPGVTFQWRKNNIDIPGETGTTYLVSTGGSYRVVVFDGVSSCPAVSRNILFTVKPTPPAVITVPGGTLTACEEVGVQLDANLGSFSYQWSRSGSPIFGWTDSSVKASISGIYSVKVRSADGCVSVSSDVSVTILPSPVPVITRGGVFPFITLTATPTSYVSYTWMRTGVGGSGIEGTGNPFSYVTKKGTYKVVAEDVNGCKGESAPLELLDEELSVGNVSLIDIRVFPNPTQSKVYIESPVAVKVTVKDAAGKTVISQTVVKEIDLGKYADGIYLFELRDVKTEQLLKQQRVNKVTR